MIQLGSHELASRILPLLSASVLRETRGQLMTGCAPEVASELIHSTDDARPHTLTFTFCVPGRSRFGAYRAMYSSFRSIRIIDPLSDIRHSRTGFGSALFAWEMVLDAEQKREHGLP